MTISYTSLLGLAQPVTGTETGQWGTVVNDEITALLEDAVANSASISVTAGNVTLSTTNGSSNQARMATLIITGTPGTTRNVVAPSQAKIYVVINQSDGAVVIKGAATSGVTIGAGQTAQVAWNGSDFVEIGNYVHGNFVVNGNLSVNGDSTLGNAGADTTTINGQVIAANSNISKTTTLSASAPALAWIKGATYTDTGTAGGTTQALAPFTVFSAPTLSTSNIVTYTNAATVYVAGAPAAAGSATITNPYALYVAAGDAYFGASVVLNAGTANGVPYLSSPGKVLTTGSALTFNGTSLGVGTSDYGNAGSINVAVGVPATTTGGLQLWSTTSGSHYMQFGDATAGDGPYRGAVGYNHTLDALQFFASGAEKMVLTSTGLKSSIAGTNADPVFSYTSDTNTGIFFPAADKLGFVAGGGSDQMVLTSTGLGIGTSSPATKLNVSVYGAISTTIDRVGDYGQSLQFVRSGVTGNAGFGLADQNQLGVYLNSSEVGRWTTTGLGIGTSSPQGPLDVAASGATVNQFLTGGVGNNAVTGIFRIGSGAGRGASIQGFRGASSNIHSLEFYTYNSGDVFGMRLDQTGNLGIGTNNPGYKLEVNGGASDAMSLFNSTNSNGPHLRFAASSTVKAYIGGAPGFLGSGTADDLGLRAVGSILFATNGSAVDMTLDSSGNLGLGVTPSVWGAGYKAFQNGVFSLASDGTNNDLTANRFINSGGTSTYIANGFASMLRQEAGTFKFFTAPSGTAGNAISFTQAMTLDASGNLIVGGTSAVISGAGRGNVTINGSSTAIMALSVNGTAKGGAYHNGTDLEIINYQSGGDLTFYVNGGYRARITSGGDLLVGTTSTAQGADVGNKFIGTGAVWVVNAATNDAFSYYNTTAAAYRFYVSAGGTISATNTTISAISDQRFKENIRDLDVGLNSIMALKPRLFDWKAGKGKDTKDDRGFIAQEFEQVFPDLIDEWKDPAPEGEEPYKAVRADLIPVLVKAIQEQQAMINELKAKVAALQGA